MRYVEKLEQYPRKPVRPEHYKDLLLHPVADDLNASADFLQDWEVVHGPRRRFVLGGGLWFLNNTGLNPNRVAAYRERGIERFNELVEKSKVNWRDMPGLQSDPPRFWRDMARQQVNRAFNGEAVYLSKLMYILATCEVAVEDMLRRRQALPNVYKPIIEAPEDIYAFMSVIPVCWNVNNFNESSVAKVTEEDPDFLTKVARACGQRDDATFLTELANGNTVQFDTAKGVDDYCVKNNLTLDNEVSRVRATPGRFLGTRDAAPSEVIDRG